MSDTKTVTIKELIEMGVKKDEIVRVLTSTGMAAEDAELLYAIESGELSGDVVEEE